MRDCVRSEGLEEALQSWSSASVTEWHRMRLKRKVEARPRGELCGPVREFCLYPESHMKSLQGFKLDHICIRTIFSLQPSSLFGLS